MIQIHDSVFFLFKKKKKVLKTVLVFSDLSRLGGGGEGERKKREDSIEY